MSPAWIWSAVLAIALPSPADEFPMRRVGERTLSPVTAIAFSPRKKRLVTASDGFVRVWEARSGELVAAHRVHPAREIAGIGLTADENGVVFGIRATPYLLDLESGEQKEWSSGGWVTPAVGLAVDPKGQWLFLAHEDGTVRQYRTKSLVSGLTRMVSPQGLSTVTLDRAGKRVAVGGLRGTIWTMGASDLRPGPSMTGHTGEILALAFDRRGAVLASSSKDRTLRLWTVASGKEKDVLREAEDLLHSLAFHPKKDRLFTGDARGRVQIWDTKTREPILMFDSPASGPLTVLCFSPDGKTLAAAGDMSGVVLWDTSSLR